LEDLLDDSGAEWSDLANTMGINDAGQIVGEGKFRGRRRPFVATRNTEH
jgi:hypothetical protein